MAGPLLPANPPLIPCLPWPAPRYNWVTFIAGRQAVNQPTLPLGHTSVMTAATAQCARNTGAQSWIILPYQVG